MGRGQWCTGSLSLQPCGPVSLSLSFRTGNKGGFSEMIQDASVSRLADLSFSQLSPWVFPKWMRRGGDSSRVSPNTASELGHLSHMTGSCQFSSQSRGRVFPSVIPPSPPPPPPPHSPLAPSTWVVGFRASEGGHRQALVEEVLGPCNPRGVRSFFRRQLDSAEEQRAEQAIRNSSSGSLPRVVCGD